MLSDNGPQFRSKRWSKRLREIGIKEVHTAIINPKGNPAERYIKTVGECLRIMIKNKHSMWGQYLGKVEEYINYNYNESTQLLSVEVQLGRKCVLKWERNIKYPPVVNMRS